MLYTKSCQTNYVEKTILKKNYIEKLENKMDIRSNKKEKDRKFRIFLLRVYVFVIIILLEVNLFKEFNIENKSTKLLPHISKWFVCLI